MRPALDTLPILCATAARPALYELLELLDVLLNRDAYNPGPETMVAIERAAPQSILRSALCSAFGTSPKDRLPI